MTFSLAELLKDSAYKLTQFNATQIQALEAAISLKVTEKSTAPYVTCLVRGKPIKLTPEEAVRQSFTLKAESERLLEVAKHAVEIAIEQDEQAALDCIATECSYD